MAKTNWQYGEIVTEENFNQLGQEVNEATAGLAVLEEQLGEAEQSSKAYTDQQIQLVTATGIPKLVTYSYVLAADQQGQTDFEIPLETFVKETDTVTVAQNSTVLSTERYSVVEPKIVRLVEGVNIGTEIFVQVWKNVPIGPDGAISASVLANDTVTESKMADEMKKDVLGGVAGYDAFATHLADRAQHIGYATASGINTYTTSITGITALLEGLSVKIKFTNANTGASTLNINGLGAKNIVKGNGSALSSGNIKAGQIVHIVYTGSNFQLLGEGGEYGTAGAVQVLSGYTVGTENGLVNGTMSNNPSQTATLQITDSAKPTKAVPAGYTPGGTITAQLAPALADKILTGNTVGGVAGNARPERIYYDSTYRSLSTGSGTLSITGAGFTPTKMLLFLSGGGTLNIGGSGNVLIGSTGFIGYGFGNALLDNPTFKLGLGRVYGYGDTYVYTSLTSCTFISGGVNIGYTNDKLVNHYDFGSWNGYGVSCNGVLLLG